MHTLRTTLVLLAALFCGPAFAEDTSTNDGVAQDDGDDDLGDILGGPSDSEQSSEEEARDFASGNTGSTIGARNEDVQLVEGDGEKKRLIKTIQRKNFFKKGREGLTWPSSQVTPSSSATSLTPDQLQHHRDLRGRAQLRLLA